MWPPHYLLQFGGVRGTSNAEIWICGIRLAALAPEVTEPLNSESYTLTESVLPWLQAWYQRLDTRITPTCLLKWIKFHYVDSGGHYAPGSGVRVDYTTGIPGGAGAAVQNAYQLAVKHTFLTDTRSRGLASRGGIYVPGPSISTQAADGLFPASIAQGMADSTAQLLREIDIDQIGKPHIYPSIISRVGDGLATRVTQVRVDNRVDVLRRRANRVAPATRVANVNY